MRIEDKHCSSKIQKKFDFQAKALAIEGPHKHRPNKFKNNGPKRFFGNGGNKLKDYKTKGNNQDRQQCWVCGGMNHIAKDCYFRRGHNRNPPKGQLPPNPQANVVIVGATSDSLANRYFAGSP